MGVGVYFEKTIMDISIYEKKLINNKIELKNSFLIIKLISLNNFCCLESWEGLKTMKINEDNVLKNKSFGSD